MSPWCLESTHHSQGRESGWELVRPTKHLHLVSPVNQGQATLYVVSFNPGELTVTIKPSSLVTVDHKERPPKSTVQTQSNYQELPKGAVERRKRASGLQSRAVSRSDKLLRQP